jgi:hypothetical protein
MPSTRPFDVFQRADIFLNETNRMNQINQIDASRASAMAYDRQLADRSTAKAWVRNPAGAICRNDNSTGFVWLIWFVWSIWCAANPVRTTSDQPCHLPRACAHTFSLHPFGLHP